METAILPPGRLRGSVGAPTASRREGKMERRSWWRLSLLAVTVLLAAGLLAMALGGGKAAQAAASPRKYQYKLITVRATEELDALTATEELEKAMNEAGAEGWKLEAYAQADPGQSVPGFVVMSK